MVMVGSGTVAHSRSHCKSQAFSGMFLLITEHDGFRKFIVLGCAITYEMLLADLMAYVDW